MSAMKYYWATGMFESLHWQQSDEGTWLRRRTHPNWRDQWRLVRCPLLRKPSCHGCVVLWLAERQCSLQVFSASSATPVCTDVYLWVNVASLTAKTGIVRWKIFASSIRKSSAETPLALSTKNMKESRKYSIRCQEYSHSESVFQPSSTCSKLYTKTLEKSLCSNENPAQPINKKKLI